MTITHIQFNIVSLAVETILNGESVADLFPVTIEEMASHTDMEKAVKNTLELVDAFEVDTKQKFEHYAHDVELAIDTLENVAQNIVDMYDMSIFSEVADYYSFEDACDIIENERVHVYYDVYNMADVAEQYLNDTDSLTHVALNGNYIDESALLRDLYFGGDIQDHFYHMAYEDALEEGKTEEQAQEIASDYEITLDDETYYMELVLDAIVHDAEWLTRYFDYDAYGRDMEIEGTFIEFDNGIIEVIY